MRHKKSGKRLNRKAANRKAMFRNMARSLIIHESIRTTVVRAKELRSVVERLVTYAKKDTLAARREAYKVLGKHSLVQRLFDEIGPRFASRQGGYTRVIKLGKVRTGDGATMAIIEFTDKAAPAEPEADKPLATPEEQTPEKSSAPEKSEKTDDAATAQEDAAKKDNENKQESGPKEPEPEKPEEKSEEKQ